MWQQQNAYKRGDMVKRFSCFSEQMSEDLSDFDREMIVGPRQDGLNVPETAHQSMAWKTKTICEQKRAGNERSEVKSQTGRSWQEGDSNADNMHY